MSRHLSQAALPITLAELARLAPLATARGHHIADPARAAERVILGETFDRLRRATPHALIVLHAEAATGGWSLATALHLAWERNACAVVSPGAVASPSAIQLTQRLNMSLFVIDEDPVDAALQLAGQVSAPHAARGLRLARFAERLSAHTSLRGVLGALNAELDGVPVALLTGETLVAGRAAAASQRRDLLTVSVEVNGPGERPEARLVAALPAAQASAAPQVEALLRLARPALVAAWARTRLNSSTQAAHEQAAFGLLRRLSREPPAEPSGTGPGDQPVDAAVDAAWLSELGWQIDEYNRAVWIAPVHANGGPPDELTHLVRASWQRARPDWPLIVDSDGWVSWQSGTDPHDCGQLRRAVTGFRDTAAAHRLVLGIGCAHPGASGLMRSVTEARLAAHAARESGPASAQWFDQVGPSAALAWLPRAEIAQVAQLCMPELMSAKDRAALIGTVLAVLDCGGSLSHASERLGVHRNTVLARLARARQLGLDLDDPAQRLAVHVLCYALASPDGRPRAQPAADPLAG